jgi:hypothetical protein
MRPVDTRLNSRLKKRKPRPPDWNVKLMTPLPAPSDALPISEHEN